MPKYRQTHLSILDSDDFNDMPDVFVQLVWVLLPLILDREGRGRNDISWIKSHMFPRKINSINDDEIKRAFDWLTGKGMIIPYDIDGRYYFYVPTWKSYQSGTEREAPSKIPSPSPLMVNNSEVTQELVATYSGVTQELVKQPVIDIDIDIESVIDFAHPEKLDKNGIPELTKSLEIRMPPALFHAWKNWNGQQMIAIGRKKDEIAVKFMPPFDADLITVNRQTDLLKFELSKVPK